MGAMFFYAGWSKIISGEWSAAGYLEYATGPFATWFQSLAGSGAVDFLNMWGLLLIGIALILGVFVRTASFFGIILMVLYYLSAFDSSTAYGLIDEHVVYSFVFFLFITGGFGHIWGLDGIIERHISNKKSWLKAFFG